MLPHSIDDYFNSIAAQLPDDELARQLDAARRQALLAVRTRKDLARRRAFCFECELRRRAQQRAERNPGRA